MTQPTSQSVEPLAPIDRRAFMARGARASLAAAAATSLGGSALLAAEEAQPKLPPSGKVKHCIYIWLGGGNGQIDTWDPKRLGDPKKKVAGSYYESIPTAVKDVQVCKHLSHCADLMDRFSLLRTVHHDVIDEHAAAVNRMHTGRPTSGTVVYPSVGSIAAYELGEEGQEVPPYVIMGYPNVTRGPGFLGAKYSYLYLLDTESGPAALARPENVTSVLQNERNALLDKLKQGYLDRNKGDALVADYDAALRQATNLSGPSFMKTFDLNEEKSDLREAYGGEFGQRCLLARRLIERGANFIEVSHNLNFVNGTGWDVHNDGILNQYLLIEELDTALSTLITDLERCKLLDETLIVVAGEFGRPAGFDGGGGRGHHSKAFSVALAGGGLNNGRAVGETNELAEKIVSQPVSVPDLFATMFWSMGIDPHRELYAGDRPVPITDQGTPVRELFV